MITREQLHNAFREAGLGRIAEALASSSEPCVLLRTHSFPYPEFPVGRSKIGGVPDLPTTIDWPRWLGQPMSFLAQFDMTDLSSFSCCHVLPQSGYLWFFYAADQSTWGFDADDRGSWQVIFAETAITNLQPREPPELPRQAQFSACNVTFHDFFSIPGPEALSVAPLQLALDEIEQIEEIKKDLHEMIQSGPETHFEPHHQVLGHPEEIQGEMQRECQFGFHGVHRHFVDDRIPELDRSATDWRLLFQLDTDEAPGKPGMMWGDCGRLYFWIRHQDLASKGFDKVWMILQCS